MKNSLFIFAVVIAGLISTSNAMADAAKGKVLYEQRCASCHGPGGAGDGPVAAALPPDQKPRNLVSGAFKVVTGQPKFAELLQKGGTSFGLNPLMAAQAGLTEADINDLWAFIQSIRTAK